MTKQVERTIRAVATIEMPFVLYFSLVRILKNIHKYSVALVMGQ